MKKAFDQTVRDLKRGVNKKVLKVPRVEQKILDATSNEPWGPHGTLLADIAQASRNYHEYQMIMSVIWKRLNDTGKNWRHVYKALTVLDYLTAHGSERVIDDIREHSYQIGTLAEFQYIDSSGRDQGQNVRRKSQSLVSLVNNKERIQEVRQKADANREKYRTSFSTSGGNRPGSYPGSGGDDDRSDRSESRYGDQNGYGREREREREYNGGGSEDRYEGGRYSNYRDDDYRSSRNSDGGYGGASRNRHSFDDDDRHSSQSGGGGGGIGRKLSEPNMASAVPPSYEDATRDSPIPSHEERNGGNGQGEGVNGPESPPAVQAKSDSTVESTPPVQEAPPAEVPPPDPTPAAADGFDEFDPRNAFIASAAAPTESVPPQTAPAVNNMEMDFFGSDPIGQLALVTTTAEEQPISNNSGFDDNGLFGMPNELSSGFGQGGGAENPFGDAGVFTASQESTSNTASFNAFPEQSSAEPTPPVAPKMEAAPSFNFGDAFGDMNFGATSSGADQENSFGGATPFMSDDLSTALALVPVAPQTSSTPSSNPFPSTGAVQQPNQFAPTGAPNQFAPTGGFQQPNQFAPTGGFQQPNQFAPTGGFQQPNQFAPTGVVHQNNQFAPTGLNQPPNPYFGGPTQPGYMGPQATNNQGYVPQVSYQVAQNQTVPTTATFNHAAPPPQQVNQQPPMFSMEAPAPPAVKPQTQPQPTRKFETKSSVWTDTLNRGLVNLNISGPSINPHADIGIDFDSMNRKDKREEKKPVVPAVSSTTMMGKAMGSGSGTGRTNAPTMAPPRNPMPGTGMGGMGGMGMGTGMGMGMGMNNGTNAGYGMGMGMGMNPQMGMGMNPQMGMGGMGNNNGMGGMGYGGVGMGMGMNNNNGMGAGQPMPMRPMGGMPPGGPGAPGVGYNPMTGTGYGSQQQYGGGYR